MFLIDKYKAYKKKKEIGFIEQSLNFLSKGKGEKNIQKFIEAKKKNLLKVASHNVPYYSKFFSENNIDFNNPKHAFNKLPILTKDIIRTNYKELINSKEKDYYPINTGGSTGQPLNFEVSNYAAQVDRVHQKFQYSLIGYSPQNDEQELIANFGGNLMPKDLVDKNIFWVDKGANLPYGRFNFSSLYLTNENANLYIDKLNEIKPTILRGHTSFINELATYVRINEVELSFKPKGALLTSEMIHANQIENIKQAFNCKLTCQYGLSEVCLFSFTKDESTSSYTCSPLYGFTEILNEDGSHVKIGEEGDVVASSFYNYRMPFIRYKTGDRAVFGGYENNCLIIEELKGRSQDFIIKKNGEKISLTAVVFGVHLKAFNTIYKWQIVQDKSGEILLKIVKTKQFTKKDEEEIRNVFKSTSDIDTTFEYVDYIEKTKSGKSKFLIQKCKI